MNYTKAVILGEISKGQRKERTGRMQGGTKPKKVKKGKRKPPPAEAMPVAAIAADVASDKVTLLGTKRRGNEFKANIKDVLAEVFKPTPPAAYSIAQGVERAVSTVSAEWKGEVQGISGRLADLYRGENGAADYYWIALLLKKGSKPAGHEWVKEPKEEPKTKKRKKPAKTARR